MVSLCLDVLVCLDLGERRVRLQPTRSSLPPFILGPGYEQVRLSFTSLTIIKDF